MRSFSRFYTNILGLLNKGILDSPYSLTEVRILLEIDRTKDCTAGVLTDRLNIDRGYMSRILNRFEAGGLIHRRASDNDRRAVYIYLKPAGKQMLSSLEEKSENQIRDLINHLTQSEKERLVDAMEYIKNSLSSDTHPVYIRDYRPEDIEYIIDRHRQLYEVEYGFSSEFGDYVEKYVHKFHEHHDEDKEKIWIAESGGRTVGAIALVRVDDKTAQLRWFLIEPEMRGKGLGHKFMKTLIDFCREKDYKHILLWTVDILGAARHLYKSYGFEITETVPNNTWTGSTINEERWDLDL